MLTAEAIRAKAKQGPKLHPVKVAAWDGQTVVLQELDGLQMYEWDKACLERSKDERFAVEYGTTPEHMVRISIVTCEMSEDGIPVSGTQKRVFNDTRADIHQVRGLGSALHELYMKCLKINRLRVKDEEEAEKNSEPVLSSDSGLTSPTDGAAA